jgi:MFS family permease
MMAVIAAQFLSAFGDNALLFATLALLKAEFYPDWSQPILQMVFVGAYIIFAPFVGQVADSFPKGRVMMFANGLKLLGRPAFALASIRLLATRWWALALPLTPGEVWHPRRADHG